MDDVRKPGPDFVRVLAVATKRDWLVAAATALLKGGSWDPRTAALPSELVLDVPFCAVPLGPMAPSEFDFARAAIDRRALARQLEPDQSDHFVIRAYVKATGPAEIPERIGGWKLFSDPSIRPALTSRTDPAVGSILDVREKLDVATLAANGLDGSKVAVAMIDSGIFLPHLTRRNLLTGKDEKDRMRPRPKHPLAPRTSGALPILDAANSWEKPPRVATPPGGHRINHGTMCAYNVLAIAPNATLLDYPSLIARPPGDHTVPGTIGAAKSAYARLIEFWKKNIDAGPQAQYQALVVNNSWGIFHPSEDFVPGHPGRYIDNAFHPFHASVWSLAVLGADIVFAAGNGGLPSPAPAFLHVTANTIRGANAYAEVLTVAGCDVNDSRVGYSSQGPAISMPPLPTPDKPDLTAYTHFLGSQVFGVREPDRGTSTACPIAAGCIAALRTKVQVPALAMSGGLVTSPAELFDVLRKTARPVGAHGWNRDYGHGIINPVAAGRTLGLIR